MRKSFMILVAVLTVAAVMPAFAELQNVQVGGEVTIRGNYFVDAFESGSTPWGWASFPAARKVGWVGDRFPAGVLGIRPVGALGTWSSMAYSGDSNSIAFVEQRTRLSVKADFTNEVSTFIEMDSYDIWGEDFRSNWITGADGRAWSGDDIEMYQAYIEANEMWGWPLRARIGRQELSFGSEWLVGVNDANSFFTGLSFDGIRLTYATDMFSIDAVAAKLFEGGNAEQDGDVDFYALYGSYLGLEDITLDAYWMWVRDARALNDTSLGWLGEWWEGLWGFDDYSVTSMHTFGLRGAGTIGAFDFEAEAAYQVGDAGQVGILFPKWFGYNDDDANYDEWAANLELGYTFECAWTPRVFVGGAYFGGDDNRDLTFWQWLNPFDQTGASVSFNRMFSNWEYSQFIDLEGDMSNVWLARVGVEVQPTETIESSLSVTYMAALEEFDSPWYGTFLGARFFCPVSVAFPWLNSQNDNELGWEVQTEHTYHYSEDLSFTLGAAYLFAGDGLSEGQFVSGNGLFFNGGRDNDDPWYVWGETKIAF